MQIPLRLSGGERLTIRLHPRLSAASIFGWSYVSCTTGSGKVMLSDGGHDQPVSADLTVSRSEMFGTALRSDAGRPVHLTIVADGNGLQGDVRIDVFENVASADPLAEKSR